MAHAILSPSSMFRIIRCPASAKINAVAERRGSIAAARGTAVHEMCEALLKNRLDGITLADYYLGRTVDVDGFSFDITKDDIAIAEIYVDYINQRTEELNGKLLIEEKVNAPEISDDLWGTADAVILGESNRMVVADLKSGAWPVDVVMNEQLMTYSLACLTRWGNEDTVIEMTIIQPNKRAFHKDGQIRTWDIQAVDLADWGLNILKPACDEAMGDEPSFNAGDWCKFCSHKEVCETYNNPKED